MTHLQTPLRCCSSEKGTHVLTFLYLNVKSIYSEIVAGNMRMTQFPLVTAYCAIPHPSTMNNEFKKRIVYYFEWQVH